MQIEINGETERLIRQQLSAGQYSSPEEVVDEAVRQLAGPATRDCTTSRQGGYCRGKIKIADDFDQLPPELEAAFGVTES